MPGGVVYSIGYYVYLYSHLFIVQHFCFLEYR